ncbi:hypothetical protein [Tautonia rosea]|uniref:hypothetical protein n=1 Tax=Tautonia rosea TaxID=2728037 RepID=UPI0014762328|nr:hypothetical protein [Tautonia rosea]
MTMYRILLNPDTIDEGSPADAEMVSISASELEALRAAAASATKISEAKERAAERSLADDRLRAEEIGRWSKKAEDWERAFKAATKEKELATVLASRPLVQGAAPQLIKLWRDELEVIDEAGQFRVATRDGRSVAEAVNAWLASSEYAHFSRPTSRGGTTPPGDSRSTSTATATPPPKNLGEAVLMRWREALQGHRQNPDAPIGLGRRRF